ncbi:enoyl-CoA hydratase/isomerase [Pseudomassariella vexata]|uniref:Enoyl-CoA hydratase/isomerase n=1 Tax=Pseudomassariella vexata TaxID=1141098 RepID=A0A1Y2DJV7_9PEZI|nr:enoyl-CoA hydratase/isomerase [Pseudomassariella vexata]ORY59065.1 enoyl-CoA hydratase/isomerase [Pseudomassariella vexata]
MNLVSEATSSEHIKVSVNDDGVAVLQLDRLEKRNAFSQSMIEAMVAALDYLDKRSDIRAVIVAGGKDGPFCAGMDLKELIEISTAAAHQRQFLKDLTDAFARFTKPTIAAVIGFALGGGCEIALACDMIYAADDASFGLPEMKIGTIPGAGGTQRLARALGKHKAMEFILTGDSATGAEFERLGVVNKVFPKDRVFAEAMKLATRIAAMSAPVVAAGKQAVLTVENNHLDAGMVHEKALYYSTFSMADCKEGLSAFLEKRPPKFEHH